MPSCRRPVVGWTVRADPNIGSLLVPTRRICTCSGVGSLSTPMLGRIEPGEIGQEPNRETAGALIRRAAVASGPYASGSPRPLRFRLPYARNRSATPAPLIRRLSQDAAERRHVYPRPRRVSRCRLGDAGAQPSPPPLPSPPSASQGAHQGAVLVCVRRRSRKPPVLVMAAVSSLRHDPGNSMTNDHRQMATA
jgi:hypothetical protein